MNIDNSSKPGQQRIEQVIDRTIGQHILIIKVAGTDGVERIVEHYQSGKLRVRLERILLKSNAIQVEKQGKQTTDTEERYKAIATRYRNLCRIGS